MRVGGDIGADALSGTGHHDHTAGECRIELVDHCAVPPWCGRTIARRRIRIPLQTEGEEVMTTTEPRPSVTAQELGYDVRPLAGYIGAEILGVDLSKQLDAASVAAIRSTLLEYKVVFFRGQDITQAQHVAFGRYFGDVTPGIRRCPSVFDDFPRSCSSQPTLRADGRPLSRGRWHTDVTFVPNPPMGSILARMVVPPPRLRHAVHQPRCRLRQAL